MEIDTQTYDLDGGSKVTVYKPFGNEHYLAVVDINGRYPEAGKITQNIGRDEFIIVLRGQITATINEEVHLLEETQSILVRNGDRYFIEGIGQAVVSIRDEEGGRSEIENIKQ